MVGHGFPGVSGYCWDLLSSYGFDFLSVCWNVECLLLALQSGTFEGLAQSSQGRRLVGVGGVCMAGGIQPLCLDAPQEACAWSRVRGGCLVSGAWARMTGTLYLA